jgi:hypothetical protein
MNKVKQKVSREQMILRLQNLELYKNIDFSSYAFEQLEELYRVFYPAPKAEVELTKSEEINDRISIINFLKGKAPWFSDADFISFTDAELSIIKISIESSFNRYDNL